MVRTIQCTPHAGLPKVWLGFGEIGDRQTELQVKQDEYFETITPDIRFVHRDDRVSYWDLHRDVLFRQAKWFPFKYQDQNISEFLLPSIVRLEQVPKLRHFLYTGDYSVQKEDLRHYSVQEDPRACLNCPQLAKLLSIHLDMLRTAGFLGMEDLQALAFVRFRTLLDAAPVSVLRHAIRQVYNQDRMCSVTHHSNGYPMLAMNSCDYRPQLVLPAVLRWCGYYRLHPEWTSVKGRPKHYGEQQFTQLRQRLREFDVHLTRGLFLDTIDMKVPMVFLGCDSRAVRCVDLTDRPEILSMKSNTRRANYQYSTFLQPLPFESPKDEQELVESDSEMPDSPEDIQEVIPTALPRGQKRQHSVDSNRRQTRSMTNTRLALATNTWSPIAKRQRKAAKNVVRFPVDEHYTPAQATPFVALTDMNDLSSATTLRTYQFNFSAPVVSDSILTHVQTLEELSANADQQKPSASIDLEKINWEEYMDAPLTLAEMSEFDLALISEGLQTTETQTPSVPANDFDIELQNLTSDPIKANYGLDSLFNSPTGATPAAVTDSDSSFNDTEAMVLEGMESSQSIGTDITVSAQQTIEATQSPQAHNSALFDTSTSSVNTLLNGIADLEAQVFDTTITDSQDVDLHEWLNPEILAEPEANTSADLAIPGVDFTNFPFLKQQVASEWKSTDEVTIFRVEASEPEKIPYKYEGDLNRPTGPGAPNSPQALMTSSKSLGQHNWKRTGICPGRHDSPGICCRPSGSDP
ncbi:hypothetical protein N7499_001479 [Penicillium canescens]|uniref:Uncharacterized protein n=1 Tax=Penicillium canescens TaxID=5083 RepID=A0AAD6N5C0_PENCN|nr:uncharacterized protein N7446_009018 [Penicillium canescens]KAJ6034270.1 hypothetical protein N7460_008445 [Penicillium canescens]KAJ6045933.1 hypothetical protein N7444_007187 [Penicillium canescens]KAJ6053006.1 hypothetical protein N7446_009018 [Penicillium canescens]KAJ6097105.1 hypothetical protein N7499_001479 [Penicillium canescens]KAJ6165094.1 hypothetical protein N7485_008338 [Penicillium canescens]